MSSRDGVGKKDREPMMKISTYTEASETPEERRAANFLEVILNDRAEELLQWARLAMIGTSAALIAGLKKSR